MRLTLDLIDLSTSFVNPIRERELDLRGNKIVLIENLSATKDQHESIDLSDNEIKRLENFPLMTRMKRLYISNNRISKIDHSICHRLPQLRTLVLTKNSLSELSDLVPLAGFSSTLQELSLIDNPVSKKPYYRLFAIHILPSLKVLDFTKITAKVSTEDAVSVYLSLHMKFATRY